jgi:transposase
MKRFYTAEEDAFLIATVKTLRVRDQAAHLGRAPESVEYRRRVLMHRGDLDITQRARNRLWTEDEKALVDVMLQEGASVPQIARKTKRTVEAIYRLASREQTPIDAIRDRRGARVRTAFEVGTFMGVSHHMVARWISYGLLDAARNNACAKRFSQQRRGAPHYLITDQALMRFVEQRNTWMAWTVDRMTDADWRMYAERLRTDAGGYWMSLSEVAERYIVGYTTAVGWRLRGYMAGVTTARYGRTHYFWSADLEGWEPDDRRIDRIAS